MAQGGPKNGGLVQITTPESTSQVFKSRLVSINFCELVSKVPNVNIDTNVFNLSYV